MPPSTREIPTGSTNSVLRQLSRPPRPRNGDFSAPCRPACAVLTQATAGDSKYVAHGTRDARGGEGSEQGPNARARCLSGIDLNKIMATGRLETAFHWAYA